MKKNRQKIGILLMAFVVVIGVFAMQISMSAGISSFPKGALAGKIILPIGIFFFVMTITDYIYINDEKIVLRQWIFFKTVIPVNQIEKVGFVCRRKRDFFVEDVYNCVRIEYDGKIKLLHLGFYNNKKEIRTNFQNIMKMVHPQGEKIYLGSIHDLITDLNNGTLPHKPKKKTKW